MKYQCDKCINNADGYCEAIEKKIRKYEETTNCPHFDDIEGYPELRENKDITHDW